MKKKVILGAFILMASFASAQTKVRSTSIGIDLGGLVSLVYDDVSTLGLKIISGERSESIKVIMKEDIIIGLVLSIISSMN